MKPTTEMLVAKIVAASEDLERVETILQAIDALRPKDAAPLDHASIVAGLAVEAMEILGDVQNALFAGNEGEVA